MYKGSHDSWERLVEAVLRREQLREIALDHSRSPSTTSSVSTSRHSSCDVDNIVKTVEDMKRNGVHQPYTEPKMKAATTKIRQQIIQATTYFKNLKSQKKEKFVEKAVSETENTKFVEKAVSETENTLDKFLLFEGCNFAFDLQDLFTSFAGILGKGTFGSTYIAQLKNGQRIVLKTLKKVKVSMLEFEEQMKLLGSIKHDNVVTPRGYHFSKDYKFVLYDHYEEGNVSAMLHGDRYYLDWKTRVSIAIGTARGIGHIHTMCGGNLIHGNIKASNVFLNSHRYGCISDLGIANLISPAALPFMWIGGYAAPEVMDAGILSQASDVYSFGVLLLELLTGKSPINYRGNFVKWVHSIVREEWNVTFGENNFICTNIGELVEILKIGMSCVERVPEHRPKMSDVVRMMENVGKLNADLDYSPLLVSETLSTDFEVLSNGS